MDISMLFTALPVILTIFAVQMIKVWDVKFILKRFYFLIAVVIGLVIGAVFSRGATALVWVVIFQDAIQNAVISCFITMFKRPLGIKLPGDSGFIENKFFGYSQDQ